MCIFAAAAAAAGARLFRCVWLAHGHNTEHDVVVNERGFPHHGFRRLFPRMRNDFSCVFVPSRCNKGDTTRTARRLVWKTDSRVSTGPLGSLLDNPSSSTFLLLTSALETKVACCCSLGGRFEDALFRTGLQSQCPILTSERVMHSGWLIPPELFDHRLRTRTREEQKNKRGRDYLGLSGASRP